jgi:DNA-binding response OmpR family regulator
MENSQKTILCIDDDPYMLDVVVRHMKAKGFRVISTTDAEKGYSLAEAEKPDLIISDINMPAIDGLTLLKGFRSNKITEKIPLVLLTGSDRLADVEEGFSSGAQAYILKPFEWETAWPKIESLLKAG